MNEASSPFSLKKSIDGLSEPTWSTEVRARLGHLEGVLGAHNFELRDDSRLAFLWATGKLDSTWDANEVCHEMMSIQFICANTSYNGLSQPFLRALAKGMKERYNLKSWTTTWKIVREYGPDILKLICLVETGVQIPNFLMFSGEMVPIDPDARTETTEGDDSEATVTPESM